MVEDRAVERFRGGGQPASRPAIGGARPRIAAWMVVGEDQAGAAVDRRVGDDRAQRELGAAGIALVAGEVEAARLIVDMRDPQAFAGGSASAKQPAKKPRAASSPSSIRGYSAR